MKQILVLAACTMMLQACGQNTAATSVAPKQEERKLPEIPAVNENFTLTDYLTENSALDKNVDAIFSSLDDTAIVAQLIMPAVGRLGQTDAAIQKLINSRMIGGVLMLNGTKEEFTKWIANYETMNEKLGNPGFLYSADAEPSLVNRKIAGSTIVKKANELTSVEEVEATATTIANDLKAIGINYNFAPVVDMSPNKTVGFRSFGKVPANIIPWSDAFIKATQKNGVIATAKHFPGHGLVSGDTHKALQVIDGELKEVPNYPKLIENGVLSVMIGHLAVENNPKYNTNGLPSTLSSVIVTDLLRRDMGFKGLVVTDAMNMGGVTSVKDSDVKAVEAGVDILLMPLDAAKAHSAILARYRSDAAFKIKVNAAAKRIIRMKLCVGAIK
jgi:beta-N-acetylhexosaminidase